ncbi:VCBS repeat-containing protein [Pareuzebyella sediminis]|uniref:VCBS repeat-containing protein n=1 Tax=Pareuzebyella sediminis TaxID=2607998 RepID=UPI0011EE5224|nr:VCBS repeat-containing protein [Pareuzebyella sediminis]
MHRILMAFYFIALIGCTTTDENSRTFERITYNHSNISFSNTITENDVLNILDYEYMYNGGGVGIADFNSDGLPDVCFTGNMVSSQIYLNQGDLTFKDITDTSGFKTDQWCTGVSIVDINNDGKPDIYISTAHNLSLEKSENYFFINKTDENGEVKFENLAQAMNLADDSYTMQAVWSDFDKDGDLDVFLANNSKEEYPKNNAFGQRKDGSGRSTDHLYRNNGLNEQGIPIFEEISKEAGITIEGWSLGVTVLDINNDQWPDIYVANDFLSNDILYINNGDFTFTNRITDYLKHQSHNSMGMDAADINNDGSLDLLVLDMLPEDNLRKKTMFADIPFDRFNRSIAMGYQPQYVRNVLQVNNNDGTLSDIGYYANIAETDWSWSPLIADFDNDGLRDIYITNGYKKDITNMDFVDFNNSMNTFGTSEEKRKRMVDQLEQMEGMKKSNFFFKNIGGNRFSNTTKKFGLEFPSYSNGAAYADFDADGDLDLIVSNIDDKALLFENQTSDSNEEPSNFLRISFEANAQNLGAKVWVFTGNGMQFAEFNPIKGYLSSFEPTLHFGLADTRIIDSVKVQWPDQSMAFLTDLKANQTIEPQKEIFEKQIAPPMEKVTLLEQVTDTNKLAYRNQENSFDDFKRWPLRFRGHSKPGPVMVSGDINGDLLEDVFIGGTKNHPSTFYLQNVKGSFDKHCEIDQGIDFNSETSGALLFDADGDQDLDLYIANGSSENYSNPEYYQDRIFFNDGLGNFTQEPQSLPPIEYPTQAVVPIDFDRDGDLDLFVGGRIDATHFPFSPKSYLLQNNKGKFTNVTETFAPSLSRAGMVTDALAIDLDNDDWQDLLLVGEWMPVQLFYNKEGQLSRDTSSNGLQKSNGWWNCIKAADFDADGDIDFIAGNWGLNTPFKVSVNEPLTIYAKDFDKNGSIEPLMTQFIDHTEYLTHPRVTLMGRLPLIRKYTDTYRDYGNRSFDQIFGNYDFDASEIFKTYELASVYIENLGEGNFKYSPLPGEAQWSPLFDFVVTDLNKDQRPDVLGVGNFNDTEVLTGHYDVGNGVCLMNIGGGHLKSLNSVASGFSVPEEARVILKVKNGPKDDLLIIGLQKDSLKLFRPVDSPDRISSD